MQWGFFMFAAIDLETDDLIPIGDLTKKRLGKRVLPTTIWRWRLKGVKAGGVTIKLEAVRVAGVWHTTTAAFADFIAAQTAAANAAHKTEPSERSESTERRLAKAELV
jgi:hypothetical protein